MRGGRRLPAVVVVIGLLTGCSDPAGAVRREHAAAARRSPSPAPSATAKKAHAPAWWQAPGTVKTAHGLRVHTGALRAGRMRVAITDIAGHTSRTVTATTRPHDTSIGHVTLTAVKVAKSPKTGTYGLTFHYHRG